MNKRCKNGEILAQHDGNDSAPRYFYLHDRLGSVRQLIDSSGVVKKYYTYEPFGKALESIGTPPLFNPFMFTGQYYDTEITQYYLRARMYDPLLGRFTSRDPVRGSFREPMTLHAYLYCLNDPLNYIDPRGTFYMFAELLLEGALSDYFRTMDIRFNMEFFNRSAAKIDAFSIANLQRGITMDLFIASIDTDLKGTVRDSGIEVLRLFSPNLGRLVGFVAEVSDNRKAIWEILQGNEQLDDYIGENILDAISETVSGGDDD